MAPTPKSHDASETEDLQKVREFLSGDHGAFEFLFDKYRDRVFGVAYRFLRHKDDALEVTQEVFLRVYQGLARFKTESKFFTWLYRITVNKAIDYLRSKRSRPSVALGHDEESGRADPLDALADPRGKSPSDDLERRETFERLATAVGVLSEKHRTVFLLHAVEDLSYKEIADVVGCNLGTVMSRLFYARKKLQQLMTEVAK
jgi:RNA polymerase sigma-70 factor (ECF subfamily)